MQEDNNRISHNREYSTDNNQDGVSASMDYSYNINTDQSATAGNGDAQDSSASADPSYLEILDGIEFGEQQKYPSGITLKKIDKPKPEHRKEFVNYLSRQRLKEILAAAAIALVLMIIYYSPLFAINKITVTGNVLLTQEDVCRIARLSTGESLFSIKTDEISRTLTKDLRIDKATIRRRFPNGLDIYIIERTPVLSIACDYGYLNVAQGGIILDATRGLQRLSVPILTGINAGDLFVGDTTDKPEVLAALQFIQLLPPETVSQISELNVSDPNNVIGYTKNGVQMKMGNITDRMSDKAAITDSFVKELKVAKHPIEYIDFKYAMPYIKLKQGV